MPTQFAEIFASPAAGEKIACVSLPDGWVEVATTEELQSWLRRIAAEFTRPLLVEVARADGDLLSIGLGGPRSFLTYIPADGDPPYFSVVDDATDDEEICFDCNGEPSFYSVRNTVTFHVALDVAGRFAQASGLPLPDLVAWEEV